MKRIQFIKVVGGFFSGGWMFTKILYNRHLAERKSWTLYKGWLSGCAYYDASDVMADLAPGQPLILQREPQNKYDKNAIEVYAGRAKLGYVAQMDNPVLAALMDSGENLTAETARIQPGGYVWEQIEIKIKIMKNRNVD